MRPLFLFLNRLLESHGAVHTIVSLIPNQRMYCVAFGQSAYNVVFVLPNTLK